MGRQTASEDFSDIPAALTVTYHLRGVGRIEPELQRKAADAGRIAQDVPANHAADFAAALQRTWTPAPRPP